MLLSITRQQIKQRSMPEQSPQYQHVCLKKQYHRSPRHLASAFDALPATKMP